jgi:hypothetical protein
MDQLPPLYANCYTAPGLISTYIAAGLLPTSFAHPYPAALAAHFSSQFHSSAQSDSLRRPVPHLPSASSGLVAQAAAAAAAAAALR